MWQRTRSGICTLPNWPTASEGAAWGEGTGNCGLPNRYTGALSKGARLVKEEILSIIVAVATVLKLYF